MSEKIPKGRIVAAIGLPGSGKSSVMGRLANLCQGQSFLEPEEGAWTDAVHQRERVGYATAITWFRSVRVPLLYKAEEVRDRGGFAFVDCYYDKLVSLYLGKPGMEWLLKPVDPYFDAMKRLADTDYKCLPNADCVVSFRVSKTQWENRLKDRNRNLDKSSNLHETYVTQSYFFEAAEEFCRSNNAKHIMFDNDAESVAVSAKKLENLLKEHGVV